MHSCLHIWPGNEVLQILGNITPAFKRGYGKLLINEDVVTATNLDPLVTSSDLMMMGIFSAWKRFEAGWKKVLWQASFNIVNIWSSLVAFESAIEAELT